MLPVPGFMTAIGMVIPAARNSMPSSAKATMSVTLPGDLVVKRHGVSHGSHSTVREGFLTMIGDIVGRSVTGNDSSCEPWRPSHLSQYGAMVVFAGIRRCIRLKRLHL